jgi:DNA-binding response OmpR family regulator
MSSAQERALVLVADDEEVVRAFVACALRSGGFRVVEACDGEDALSWAAQYHGRIHLLVTDCAMPRLDGVKLSERLKSFHPETGVLFITGCWSGLTAPAEQVLYKPFGVRDLLERVESLVASL